MSNDFTELTACLACGGKDLIPYLDLGEQPLANSFHDGTVEQHAYPLGLAYCPGCFHSQQRVAVNPDLLFRDYLYASGTSRTLTAYFADFVDKVETQFQGRKLRVLDIGCNDASLLREFARRGHECVGVDPSAGSLATEAFATPVTIIVRHGYWEDHAKASDIGSFDVIVAMNVLAHVADPMNFLQLALAKLNLGGRVYVQTSQAHMVENGEFDTCYHEHLSFFTARSFMALAKRAGAGIESMKHVPIHGTSYLVEMSGRTGHVSNDAVSMQEMERKRGIYEPETYEGFALAVDDLKERLPEMIDSYRKRGYTVIGYGAAAKGMTVLNHTGMELDFILDDAPLKIGKLCPGSNIPVVSTDTIKGKLARYLIVVLAWNFKQEIMNRVWEMRPGCSDLFLTYFPKVEVE
jgi:SAM-dependent methyltransferase